LVKKTFPLSTTASHYPHPFRPVKLEVTEEAIPSRHEKKTEKQKQTELQQLLS